MRASGTSTFDSASVQTLFENLEKNHGISFPTAIRAQALKTMTEHNEQIDRAFNKGLQTYSMLRMQKQPHAGIVALQQLSRSRRFTPASSAARQSVLRFQTASYVAGSGLLQKVQETVYGADSVDVYADEGGWAMA